MEDEDAEWLLDDPDDRDTGPQDALSGLSKESRDILASIGLGGPIKPEEEDDLMEEQIKVWTSLLRSLASIVTSLDLLHLKNTFPIIAIHHRTSPTHISALTSNIFGQR